MLGLESIIGNFYRALQVFKQCWVPTGFAEVGVVLLF